MALAQSASSTSSDGSTSVIEDIVVTANRIESAASKTPIALTAITGGALLESGVSSTSALADYVPNLTLASNNGGLQVSLRGVSNPEPTERGDPSAAFMVDEIYYGRTAAIDVSLFDVRRVEVLRGPQGTLFGRNTTAGLIHVLSNTPEFEFGGSADVTIGDYGTVQTTGVLNMPVTDNLALRAAVNYDRRDNFVDTGPLFTGDIGPARDNKSGRLQALYRWDTGEVLVKADYSDIGGSTYDLLVLDKFFTPSRAANPVGNDPTYISRSTSELLKVNAPVAWDATRDDSTWGLQAKVQQTLGPIDAIYVAGYREYDRFDPDHRISADGLSAHRLIIMGDYEQQSHEFRVVTNSDGPLKAQAGAYYFKEDLAHSINLLLTPNTDFVGNTVFFDTNKLINESYAFFGQGTYSLIDTLRLTAGVRYSNDVKSRPDSTTSICDRFDCSGTQTVTSVNRARGEFSKTTWKVGLDYDLSDYTLLYANISTGYKAGGFNDGCEVGTQPGCTFSADALYYDPETLTSYEAGAKGSLSDGKLRYDVTAFHYDYEDLQLFQLVADCGGGASCSTTTNAGKAKVDGLELQLTLLATQRSQIDLGATYLDARYSDFRPDATFNFAGRPLNNSPEWTLSPGYRYTFDLGAGDLEFGVRSKISDEYKFLLINTRNYYTQPSYSKTDVTVTYHAPAERWYGQAFVKNIENEIPITTVFVATRSSVQVEAPRTYGVRFGMKF